MAESDMVWRSNDFRQQFLNKIEEARKKSVAGANMNASEIENHAFQGAKSQEEYLGYIQKILQRLQHGPAADVGQPGALQNTVGIRSLSMPQRPGLTAFSNPAMMQRSASLGIPRGEIFGMQPTRPGLGGPNQMVINSTIMPQNFPQMMQLKSQPTIMQVGAGPNAIAGPIPSPVGGHIPGSLASAAMPSPGNALPTASPGPHIVPSPANRNSIGIPSPGNLNTPGNPGSVGPVGGASGAVGPSKLSAAEEQAYLEKWKQLQKYIEPLKRMINRIDKDEDRNVDLNKMKNLLDILSDSTKRLPIQTLLKCEKVLEKQFLSQPTLAHPPAIPPLVVSSGSSDNMCQALLDVVAAHMKSPTLNHTLQRTFGPAVRALHGPSISVETPLLKKRKVEEADDGFEIDDIIQGEIARLHHRFIVNLDSSYQSGSKIVLLQCKLEDRNLPSVPQIFISLPENYPHGNPACLIKSNDYECSSFLQRVYKFLLLELNRLTGCYSLTALLNLWASSLKPLSKKSKKSNYSNTLPRSRSIQMLNEISVTYLLIY